MFFYLIFLGLLNYGFIFFLGVLLSRLEFSWSGSIFIVEGYFNWRIVYLSFFIYLIILISDLILIIAILSSIMYLLRVFFFIYNFFFYVFFELSLVPILIIVLGYGIQIEKINSIFYLLFYAIFSTFPFLYLYFNIDYFIGLVYLDFKLREEFIFFLLLGFL